jgi:hypothetical protein
MADRPAVVNEDTRYTITFNVSPRYDPGQAIACEYQVNPTYQVQSRDYVALYSAENFHPGESYSNYITWQWADIRMTSDGHRAVTFPARHLPQASSNFLLFAYVSRSHGILGSSDHFQIFHFCGEPISIVSYTTDKSSFVVLEKCPSDVLTSVTSPMHISQNTLSNSNHAHTSEGKNDESNSSTSESEFEDKTEVQDEKTSEKSPVSGHIPENIISNPQEMDENNVTEDILDINSEIASPIASPLNEIKSSTDPEPERAQNSVSAEDEIELLQSKLAGKMEIKTTVEKTSPESEAILKPSDTLEGKQMQAVEMSRQISGKQPDVTALNDRIAQLTQENQYLSNKVKSVKSQLQTKEQDLSHTKGKLRAANTRIRDLEHALVTERLTYENTRKRVMKVDQAVDTNTIMEPPNSDHSHSEEVYYTTVQGDDEKKSSENDLASFIPTEQRSQSALVRLGIDFESEDEVTSAKKVPLPDRTQKQTTDIRCPICGKPASSFRDQAAFHVHVNKHFLD